MKKPLVILNRSFVGTGIFFLFVAGDLFAQVKTNSTTSWGNGFVRTNGEYVTIGGIMVETNSPLNTDYFKQLMWRDNQLMKIADSKATTATDLLAKGGWALIKDYPIEANGYQSIMMAIGRYEYFGQSAKLRALVDKLIASSLQE